ncbi:MAG TPA: FUSC family protein, partial [Polyangiaceae bacterium]|nr:FUSC family protein [Polyangiaceae bacterium]
RLLPVVAARLRYLHEEVEAIRGLLQGDQARSSLGPEQLGRYVADDDTWPLRALRPHLSLRSPVLRHALRSSLAFTSVYLFAYALPWTARPYWMLLSVAVVLRGTLDDTLSRRNSRVLGTAIGCVLVTLLVPLVAEPALKLTFVGAVGVAHAFVNVRYLLTAIAATVMALLQAHFASPTTVPLVVERLLDTVIGALFAWGFSYVLPSWERRTLPAAVERALEALRAYSLCALELEGARAEQRLARQRAYDALEVVAAALRRSAAEPRRVRPPIKELVIALDHAQRLMAHLSSMRSLLLRRGQRLAPAEVVAALADARRTIAERLSLTPPPPTRARQSSYGDLPGAPVEQEPLPWLLRRLDASIHDAAEAGAAARSALSRLSGLTPPA